MKSILIPVVAFCLISGCANSDKNSTLQPQKSTISVQETVSAQIIPEDTATHYTYVATVPEHIQQEEGSSVPREQFSEVPAPIDQPESSLREIHHFFEKEAEVHKLRTNVAAEIRAKEGTKIVIPANAFIYSATGETVEGEIEFFVTEYYKMEDILFSKLSTRTTEAMLESGGMLYLEARANDQPCLLAAGKQLAIDFFGSSVDNNMQIFDGVLDSNGNIIWELQVNPGEDQTLNNNASGYYFSDNSNTEYIICEKMPEFYGGNIAMSNWLNSKLTYPDKAIEAGIQGVVYVNFVVTDSGTVRDVNILKGIGYGCDEIALAVIKSMPAWSPGFQNNIAVDVSTSLPIKFTLENNDFFVGVSGERPDSISKITDAERGEWLNGSFYRDQSVILPEIKRIVPEDTFNVNSEAGLITGALLYTNNLGWINCDRFIQINEPKTNYTVAIEGNEDIDLTIIFENYNAAIRGGKFKNAIKFFNVLRDEPIILFGIKNVQGQLYYCLKETVTSVTEERDIEFIPATKEELKVIAATLNKPAQI